MAGQAARTGGVSTGGPAGDRRPGRRADGRSTGPARPVSGPRRAGKDAREELRRIGRGKLAAETLYVLGLAHEALGERRALEIIRLIERRRASGDRVGIVTYGREARVERLPQAFAEAGAFVQSVDGDGSDLGSAISLAASLIPRGRPGRLIVLSADFGRWRRLIAIPRRRSGSPERAVPTPKAPDVAGPSERPPATSPLTRAKQKARGRMGK